MLQKGLPGKCFASFWPRNCDNCMYRPSWIWHKSSSRSATGSESVQKGRRILYSTNGKTESDTFCGAWLEWRWQNSSTRWRPRKNSGYPYGKWLTVVILTDIYIVLQNYFAKLLLLAKLLFLLTGGLKFYTCVLINFLLKYGCGLYILDYILEQF